MEIIFKKEIKKSYKHTINLKLSVFSAQKRYINTIHLPFHYIILKSDRWYTLLNFLVFSKQSKLFRDVIWDGVSIALTEQNWGDRCSVFNEHIPDVELWISTEATKDLHDVPSAPEVAHDLTEQRQ